MNEAVEERITVLWREKQHAVHLDRYEDSDNTRITLRDGDGAIQATVTADVEPLAPDLCYVKSWSENRGVEDALKRYLQSTGEFVPVGAQRMKQYFISGALMAQANFEYTPSTEMHEEPPLVDTGIEVDILPEDSDQGDPDPEAQAVEAGIEDGSVQVGVNAFEEGGEAAEVGTEGEPNDPGPDVPPAA